MKPSLVPSACERCERPSLVFDRARIEANVRALRDAARSAGLTVLFAAKSFPHREVWGIAAELLDGFDAASEGEIAALPAAGVGVLSVVDPSGRAGAAAAAVLRARGGRVIVGCETVEQVHAAPAGAEIAIRLSASLTGRDPAIGAVLDGTGHRRSRFGLDVGPGVGPDVGGGEHARAAWVEEMRAMVKAAAGRPVGLHVHHGPVTATTGARFVETARAMMAAASEAELVPRFVDLGGAWHAVAALPAAFAEVRAAVPREIEVIVEPGRLVTEGAGFAAGRVVVARELGDRPLRVLDLSRICHLRWSQVDLVLGSAPRPGAGRSVLLVGPTCYEEDVIGEWTIEPAQLGAGARVVLRNVSGYAVAWNTSFGGVPAADVIIA